MYCSAFDYLSSSSGNRMQQDALQQNEQQQGFPAFYHQPQLSQSFTNDFPPYTNNNRPMTPLDATFQPYFGDDLLPPATEVGADNFLLPAFTTVYQGADNQQQSSRLYSDFMGDTPQPQYANLVVSGSAIKQPPPQPHAQINKDLPTPQPFASGLLSPFPVTLSSDFYYDSIQPYPATIPLPSPAANNSTTANMVQTTNNELSLLGSCGFVDQQRQPEPLPQYFSQQEQFCGFAYRQRQDAAVDTCDLTTAKHKRQKKFLGAGVLPPQDVPLVVIQRSHKCTLCGSSFSRGWTLRQHMASHGGVKTFYCPLCGKSFARRQNVAYHLKHRHSLPLAVHWALSDSNGGDETVLLRETLARQEGGSYNCLTCNQTFKTGTGLRLLIGHARRHAAIFCCMATHSCRKRFRSIEALIAHSNSDHFSAPPQSVDQQLELDCSQCSASFNNWLDFQKHLAQHAQTNIRQITAGSYSKPSFSKRKYKCLQCWKTFSTRLALSRHLQRDSHAYSCTVCGCGRVFPAQRRLEAHMKFGHRRSNAVTNDMVTNETLGKFSCLTCNRSFTTSAGLARHATRTHKNVDNNNAQKQPKTKTRIPCPFRDSVTRPCGSMFDRQSQVDKHVKLYHRKRGHRHKSHIPEPETTLPD